MSPMARKIHDARNLERVERCASAWHTSVATDLERLALDPDPWIRQVVASNRCTPPSAVRALRRDLDPLTRLLAADRLGQRAYG